MCNTDFNPASFIVAEYAGKCLRLIGRSPVDLKIGIIIRLGLSGLSLLRLAIGILTESMILPALRPGSAFCRRGERRQSSVGCPSLTNIRHLAGIYLRRTSDYGSGGQRIGTLDASGGLCGGTTIGESTVFTVLPRLGVRLTLTPCLLTGFAIAGAAMVTVISTRAAGLIPISIVVATVIVTAIIGGILFVTFATFFRIVRVMTIATPAIGIGGTVIALISPLRVVPIAAAVVAVATIYTVVLALIIAVRA